MRYFRNNREKTVIRENDNGRRYYKVFDEMKKYQGDVMIVYGDKDPIAAGDYMERARQTYRSCEVNVVPDGAHGFPASITHVKANGHIVKFLKEKLKD